MAEYKLTFGEPQAIVVDNLPLSNWTIVNTNTLSINGDTVTQLGVGGWYESMFVSFTVPETGSYKISYDYNITNAKVGNHGTYGFGLWLTTNNPNVTGDAQYNFYMDNNNHTGGNIGSQGEDISGKSGNISFTTTLNAGTTYYLWYPGAALDDGTTYTLSFTNLCVYNNPIQYIYNNILSFTGWDGYLKYEKGSSTNILDYYPIGSYFTTKNDDFDPNVLWGGEWELDTNGRVTRGGTTVGQTGGEINHETTVNEIPGHTHTTNRALWNNNGSMFGNDSNWSMAVHLYSTGINVGRVNLTCSNPNTSSSSHNNVQKSLICKRWHRVG